jgi:uncharacterized protein YutE (UPF0331/DUF86 family)
MDGAQKSVNYHEATLRTGELGVLPPDFVRHLAPLAGFRNILVHEYVDVDWDQVYHVLQNLQDLESFASLVRRWLRQRIDSPL